MPIVLATGAPTASGHSYDDVLGAKYEFPPKYRKLVTPGEPFVYYRGRRGYREGQPGYFGAGVVGSVDRSSRGERLVAELHDVEIFEDSVPIKSVDDIYLETGGQRGVNWANGVRRISTEAMARILQAATTSGPAQTGSGRVARGYSWPRESAPLERYSITVALRMLAEKFGSDAVQEMPPGNPGFDIRVTLPIGDLHVEVKGTVLPDPVFHLSEGQRRHAHALGDRFWLVVVYRVRLGARTHEVVTLTGPLDPSKVDLRAEGWAGRVVV